MREAAWIANTGKFGVMFMTVKPVTTAILPVQEEIEMLKKNLSLILLLVFCVSNIASQSSSPKQDIYHVKYLSAENVYLDAGKLAGLTVGDLLTVRRNNQDVAELEIVYLSDYSASCNIKSSTTPIKPGDLVYLKSKAQNTGEETLILQKDSITVVPVTDKVNGTTQSRRNRSPFSGSISLQYYTWQDLDPTQLDFSQPTLRLNLRGRKLWGKDYYLNIRGRIRRNNRSRSLNSFAPQEEWRNRIFELSFSYNNPNAILNYQLGRIISNKFSGVGYIDGLLLHFNTTEKLGVGAFAGTQPQWQYSTYQTSIQKYGGYLNYKTGNFSTGLFESTIAAVGEYHGAEVSREFIYFQNSFNGFFRWNFFQSAEVDINRKWRKDYNNSNITLTSLFLSGQWKATEWLMVGILYDNRRNYLTYETRTLADSLFDESLRQGLRGNLTLILPQNYRIFGNFGIRKMKTDVESTISYAGGVSKTNLIWRGSRIFLNGSGFSSFYTHGLNYSVMFGQLFMNGIQVDLGIGGYQYDLKTSQTKRHNQWSRFQLWTNLPYHFYFSGQYEYDWGDEINGNRILLEIGYRL